MGTEMLKTKRILENQSMTMKTDEERLVNFKQKDLSDPTLDRF